MKLANSSVNSISINLKLSTYQCDGKLMFDKLLLTVQPRDKRDVSAAAIFAIHHLLVVQSKLHIGYCYHCTVQIFTKIASDNLIIIIIIIIMSAFAKRKINCTQMR